MQIILGAYRIACMTSATLAGGVFCNTNFCYSRLKTCDADRCKRANVSLGKVCNTNASKFGGGGTFHCNIHRQFTSPAAVGGGPGTTTASATSQLKTTTSGGFLNNLGFGNTTLDPAEIASLGPLPPPAALDLLEIVNKRPATVEEVRKRSPSPPPVRNSPLAVWRETGKPRPIPFLASTREQQAVLASGGDPRGNSTSSPQHSPTTMTRLNKFQILDPVAQVFEQNVANLLSKTNQELELGMNTWRGGLDRPKNILKPHFASPRFPPRRGVAAAGGQQQQETAQKQIHPSSYNRTMEEEERPRQQLPMPASSSAAASPERNLKALGLGDDGMAATSSQSPTAQIRPSALLEQQYLHLENMSNRTQNLAAELLNRRRSREEDLVQKRQSLRMVAQLKMKASQAVRRVSANTTTSVQEGGISKTASSKSKSPPPGSAARRHEFDKMHKKRSSRPEIAETRMTVNNDATDASKQDDVPLFDQVDKLPGGREFASSSSVSSGSLYNSGTSTPRSAVVRTAANINIISPEGGIVRGTSPAAAGAAGGPLPAVASTTTQQESGSIPKRGTVFDSANNLLTAVDQHFSKTLLQVSSDKRIASRVQEQVTGGTSGRNTPRTPEAGPALAGVHHQPENKEPIVVFASSLLRRASERGEHEIDNLVLPPAMSRASSFNSERGAGDVEQASSKKSINEALANKIKIAEELQQKLGKETKSKERLLQGLDAVRDILIESVKDHMEDIKTSGSPRTETQEQQRAEFLLAAEKLSNGTKMNNNKSNRMFATPPTFIHPPKDASKQGILPSGSHDQKKQHVFQLLKTLHKQEGGNKETVNSLRQELNEFLAALDEEEVFS